MTGEVLDAGDVPIVLGGDCSILLGNLLALRRRGRHGLLFIDGHADFYQPEAEPNYAVVMEAWIHGVSTRKVDDLVAALGIDSGISKSTVSRICADLDRSVSAFILA